ncbi:hypothetical protein PoB_002989900 [Plakobranchus ocellatus]|uniref:Uncharacterized protein n=1 Tax=Plakobranchus ocellatus TaxID=259542 RepID=A0AAV4A6S8_9GAST|nr:hypothetical protein PoB_002989900 [Plakobranchus ocellatus]
MYIASPPQGDLRLSGPPSGKGAGGGVRARDRMIPADIRADSLRHTLDEISRLQIKFAQGYRAKALQMHNGKGRLGNL